MGKAEYICAGSTKPLNPHFTLQSTYITSKRGARLSDLKFSLKPQGLELLFHLYFLPLT
jgi:hypothetical protein